MTSTWLLRRSLDSRGFWAVCGLALLFTHQATFASEPDDGITEIVVSARRLAPLSELSGASTGVIDGEALSHTVAFRSSELLETVPGLAVTLHSGESKANQYLLRGANLDHGTDLAIAVDGMPINEPTHAHGQGYAEIRPVIPELLDALVYSKGTAQADVGDFGAVGSLGLTTVRRLQPTLSWSVGEHAMERLFVGGSVDTATGTWLSALEGQTANGPWVTPEQQRLLNVFEKWTTGDAARGASLSASFFHNASFNQTDQPERAIGGVIPNEYAELDPSDQGKTQRLNLIGEWHQVLAQSALKVSGYAFDNRLQLVSNYTHALIDPLHGDQEEQFEHRHSVGGQADYRWSPADSTAEWRLGVQTRHDDIDLGRRPTEDAQALDPLNSLGFFSEDWVHLHSVGAYVAWQQPWSALVHTQVALRDDWFWSTDAGTHAGAPSAHLLQPKATLRVDLGANTQWVSTAGVGFHSNDVRGGGPLLAEQRGADTGLIGRVRDLPIDWSITAFYLHSASSTTYDPDVGQDSAGPASQRVGVETAVHVHGEQWDVEANFSKAHARFLSGYDDGTGHWGEAIPNAPFGVGSFAAHWHRAAWRASLQWRYLGDFPLTSGPCYNQAVRADFAGLTQCAQAPTAAGAVTGHDYQEWSGALERALSPTTSVQLSVFNLFNTHAHAMEYYYVDRLPGEPAVGVADVHVHPLEPLSLRLTFTTHW